MQTRVKIAASRPFSGASKDSCGSVEDRTYSTVLSSVEGGEGSEMEGSWRVARSPTKHLTLNKKYATKEERRGKSNNTNKNIIYYYYYHFKRRGKRKLGKMGNPPMGKRNPRRGQRLAFSRPPKFRKSLTNIRPTGSCGGNRVMWLNSWVFGRERTQLGGFKPGLNGGIAVE